MSQDRHDLYPVTLKKTLPLLAALSPGIDQQQITNSFDNSADGRTGSVEFRNF